MSKLLDKLDRIGRGRTTSLGFGSAGRAEKLPAMAVVGVLTDQKAYLKQAAILSEVGADAVLLGGASTGKALTDVAKKLDSMPWGPKVGELGVDEAAGFRDAGCDFLAFGPENSLLGAIEGESTGYFLCVDPGMEERFLRTIEDLSVDGVLLPSSSVGLPLTVEHMMTLGVVREAFSKYLFLELPGPLSARELEGLRDMGIDGVVVNPAVLSKEDIQEMISSLKSLPKKQPNKSRRPDAVLPKPGMGFVSSPDIDDDDDDDE